MSYLYKTPEGLLPCPFCGGEAHIKEVVSACENLYTVGCSDSECMGYETWLLKPTREEAMAAWNRRAERTCGLPVVRDEEECERQAGVGVFVAQEIPLCRKCTSCGRQYSSFARLPEWLRYCPNCGARVVSE